MLARSKRLRHAPVDDVTGAVQQVVDVDFQSGVLKNAHGAFLVEFDEHIDVTLGASFASCH
jgi:hypothetical protein